jgi:hypothetical protein
MKRPMNCLKSLVSVSSPPAGSGWQLTDNPFSGNLESKEDATALGLGLLVLSRRRNSRRLRYQGQRLRAAYRGKQPNEISFEL